MNLRIGIIGVGRRRNGIGEYVAKFCSRAGAEVVAHVSSSMERAILHANDLAAEYQILSKPYSDIEKFFVNEKLDAVAICTPALLHKVQLDAALAHSVHVFCEKPLLWESNGMVKKTKNILNAFEEANLVLYQDTQWTSTLSVFEKFYGQLDLDNICSFSIEMYPPDSDSKSMIAEAAPHANSLLLALGGKPPAEALSVQLLHCVRDETELRLYFTVSGSHRQPIEVYYRFIFRESQPRPFAYAINGTWLHREIDFSSYQIYLCAGPACIPIQDPLEKSITYFLGLVASAKKQKIAKQDLAILKNMELLSQFALVIEEHGYG